MAKRAHYFYSKPILAKREEEYIELLLAKYKNEQASPELKQKIWNDLQWEKHLGNISIPFKVVFRKDSYGKFPPSIEVILDTKV